MIQNWMQRNNNIHKWMFTIYFTSILNVDLDPFLISQSQNEYLFWPKFGFKSSQTKADCFEHTFNGISFSSTERRALFPAEIGDTSQMRPPAWSLDLSVLLSISLALSVAYLEPESNHFDSFHFIINIWVPPNSIHHWMEWNSTPILFTNRFGVRFLHFM